MEKRILRRLLVIFFSIIMPEISYIIILTLSELGSYNLPIAILSYYFFVFLFFIPLFKNGHFSFVLFLNLIPICILIFIMLNLFSLLSIQKVISDDLVHLDLPILPIIIIRVFVTIILIYIGTKIFFMEFQDFVFNKLLILVKKSKEKKIHDKIFHKIIGRWHYINNDKIYVQFDSNEDCIIHGIYDMFLDSKIHYIGKSYLQKNKNMIRGSGFEFEFEFQENYLLINYSKFDGYNIENKVSMESSALNDLFWFELTSYPNRFLPEGRYIIFEK